MMQLATNVQMIREVQLEVGRYIPAGWQVFRHGRSQRDYDVTDRRNLTPIPADQVALNKAAEYLLDALASQLKPFLQALAADGSSKKCSESR
jgi:hypothetical protein